MSLLRCQLKHTNLKDTSYEKIQNIIVTNNALQIDVATNGVITMRWIEHSMCTYCFRAAVDDTLAQIPSF